MVAITDRTRKLKYWILNNNVYDQMFNNLNNNDQEDKNLCKKRMILKQIWVVGLSCNIKHTKLEEVINFLLAVIIPCQYSSN